MLAPEIRGSQYLAGIDVPESSLDINKYLSVTDKFRELSQHPPKGDPYMGAFYDNALRASYEDPQFINLVSNVIQSRDITAEHFANLLFRGVQFIELSLLNNNSYPNGLNNPAAWNDELKHILEEKGQELQEVLLTRYTTSTIYQRYAGARSIMAALYAGRDIAAADFGCGGNYGLPGISLSEPFKDPEAIADNKNASAYVSYLLSTPLDIKKGLSLDIENPQDEEIKKWRLACSFYPQELYKLPQVVALEERLQQAKNVSFQKADLLELPIGFGDGQVAPESFDVVIISTLLYQMSEEKKARVLNNAKNILKQDGIIIVQDFVEKNSDNPSMLNSAVDWFKNPFSYRNFIIGERTNWEMKEIFKWEDGRCGKVMKGEDFDSLYPPYRYYPAA